MAKRSDSQALTADSKPVGDGPHSGTVVLPATIPAGYTASQSDDQSAIDSLIAEAVAGERERCAKLAERLGSWRIAAAIRG